MEMQKTLIPEQTQPTIKSPYLSIWFHPRKTIRHILDSDPNKHVILFAMILGMITVLDRASDRYLFDKLQLPFWGFILFCTIMGVIFGPLNIYINAWIFRLVGSWFGGQAISREIRTAYAWTAFPRLFSLPLWIISIIIFGHDLFSETTPYISAHLNEYMLIIFPITGVMTSLGLWKSILFVAALAEIHQFSIWKAIVTYCLPWLVIFIPSLLLILIAN